MDFRKHEFVAAFLDGYTTFFKPSRDHSFSYFGGPLGLSDPQVLGKAHLHRLLTLNTSEIPGLQERYIFYTPLLYGITHDGCGMSYTVESDREIKIIEIEPPEPAPGWPYFDYPRILPYVPLQKTRSVPSTYEEFSGLFAQEAPVFAEDKLVVILMPPPPIGVSLWGPGSEMGWVQIIFEYDLNKATIAVTNQCD
ncbi:MAG: hypothetical protein IPN91_07355 [Holophagaceae bacterium]|jgi:hypothetical protein|uniref:Uncharacterized protein n=1 Tax=Candidatus Geothrix odensensis TaxID=2954440 RepID=A0A936F1K5_9BACT|nr:hypothetical protein [Candidatus Geothrix odensensis]